MQADRLQGRRGQARGESLVADEHDLLVGSRHLGDAVRAGGIEAPLQDVAVDDDRPGQVSVAAALLDGPDVDDEGPPLSQDREVLCDGTGREPAPDVLQDLVDAGAALGARFGSLPGLRRQGAPSTVSVRRGDRKRSGWSSKNVIVVSGGE